MDYGKFKYAEQKKAAEAKRVTRSRAQTSQRAERVAKAKATVDSFIDEQGKALVAAGTLSKVTAKDVEAKLAELQAGIVDGSINPLG
jgi:translation initiation factor IF-3